MTSCQKHRYRLKIINDSNNMKIMESLMNVHGSSAETIYLYQIKTFYIFLYLNVRKIGFIQEFFLGENYATYRLELDTFN